jgi:microsomal dipeptidase-like Zn-dependent dipeptidase
MTFVDGLQCGTFDERVLQDLRAGGVDCVTVTCAFWEDAGEALDALGRWRELERRCGELITIARSVHDIRRAVDEGRTAIVLGFQNISPFEGRISYVELFAELGVRVVQLTYNNQNEAGGSCYEARDSGLARFGRELVREMNRVGMLIDLSHVGERTSLEVIEASEVPVAISHANPSSLVPHMRNKSDDVLRALAERDGVLGCALYPNITGAYSRSATTWAELIARAVDLIGIDHVGIGTDLPHHLTQADLDWMRMGRWTREVDFGAGSATKPGVDAAPVWLDSPRHFPRITTALRAQGFGEVDIEKVTGANWLRLYDSVWQSVGRFVTTTSGEKRCAC